MWDGIAIQREGRRYGETAARSLVAFRASTDRVWDAQRGIVEADDRKVDWLFDTSHRNWVLVPSRVTEEKAHHGFAVAAQASDVLEREDPECSQQSVSDFERILRTLNRLTETSQ
ncbi:hypothetical protein [Nocardia rhamnosiphila]